MTRWTVALGLVVGSAVGCGGDKDMGSPSDPMDTGAQDTGSGGLVVRLVRERGSFSRMGWCTIFSMMRSTGATAAAADESAVSLSFLVVDSG